MSGLEFVQGLVDGTLPLNTIARTLGYDITEAESGRVVITAEPGRQLLNPAGTVHGGFSATLLDSCMGLAVQIDPGKRRRLDDAGIQDFAGAADYDRDRHDQG
jgi:acyl-coenzyme A thioesterase PaaI-like protein